MKVYSKLYSMYADGKIKRKTILHDILDSLELSKDDLIVLEALTKKDEKEGIDPEALKLGNLCLIIEQDLDPDKIDLLGLEDMMDIYKAFIGKLNLYLGFISGQIAINGRIKFIDVGEKFDFLHI